ncbi:MAG: DnaJ domain-containing protein [Clostridia bacterium]|nr:DnaJ domain-containing protein [Clostridia bacterium]
MIFKDYYKILNLETNKVTSEQIKVAYREQAKKYHPDVNVGNSNAEERFKDINEAYRVLSEANAKRKYDRMWNNYIGKKRAKEETTGGRASIVGDFFNMFFGTVDNKKVEARTTSRNQKVPKKGENIDTEINISITDAFYGSDKKISLRTVNGTMKSFDVKIPAGIQNHERIRLIGQGRRGENGGRNGDLFIKINIQDDPSFKLIGYDLYKYLPISPWEAVLGTKASLSSIDEDVSIIIPKGTQSGELIRIAGKGYKDGKGSRGDLVAEVKIMVPTNMSEEETELFRNLSKVSHFEPRARVN